MRSLKNTEQQAFALLNTTCTTRSTQQTSRALLRLLRTHTTVHVVIVGGDEVSYSSAPDDGRSWREHLQKELGERIDYKRVHLFGRMPHEQLQKLYRRSDLHIYLSRAFVLSWSLLELMACGTPVVTTNVSSIPEVVGEAGFLVEPDDARWTFSEPPIQKLEKDFDFDKMQS